jgi:hypothetical protein
MRSTLTVSLLLIAACQVSAQVCTASLLHADRFEGANDPHPDYPALDLARLPAEGGAESGPFMVPSRPQTNRVVTIEDSGSAAGSALRNECEAGAVEVQVPSAAGAIGVVNLGNVEDCDVSLGADVVISFLVIGSLPGPQHAPSHRIRIRGGQIGSVMIVGGSSDVIFDGVAINNGAVPSNSRSGTGMNLPPGPDPDDVVERVAVVNSFIRMVAVAFGDDFDGNAFLGVRARNLLFANNNIVTGGNRNAWGFRLSGGENILLVDNAVRVSFHKLVRMNDHPVDYVYIRGGVWMREDTLTSGGLLFNDAFAQLGGSTTDRIHIHRPVVYLQPDAPAAFGASIDTVQAGRSWSVCGIDWHVFDDSAMSDARLTTLENACSNVGGLCDYGVGTHSYTYDQNLEFPVNPWRDLPGFENNDPDQLPVLP